MCLCYFLLIGSVFGATIAAARLTKEIEVDDRTGMLNARSSSDHSDDQTRLLTTMKTGDAAFYSDAGTIQIIDMSNNQLQEPKRNSTGRWVVLNFKSKVMCTC